jgi:hypothetical protein
MLALWLALVLAGCASVPPALSPEQVTGFRVTAVNVKFTGDARVSWLDGARRYADSKGLDFEGPETQAHIRSTVASKLKSAVERRLADRLTGSRPVRVEIAVRAVFLSSMVQRVVIGGAHNVIAEVSLVDAKTGEVLVSNPNVVGIAGGGSGVLGVVVENTLLDEPVDRVTDSFAMQCGRWLLQA